MKAVRPRLVAAAVIACVPLAAHVRQAPQAPVFRAGVDLVTFGVTVTDRRGSFVGSLTAEDFEIVEDGRPQAIRYFSAGDSGEGRSGPEMHLGLVLDLSESMGEDLSFTKTASVKFLNSLLEAVDITMVEFETEVRVTRYSQDDYARLIERIRRQKTSGMTALYDAIGVYLDGASGQKGRKIMLLYTDGGDTTSSMSFGDLVGVLKLSDATVYVIGELEHQSRFTKNEQRLRLQQIADLTGGKAFFPIDVKELDRVYAQVLAEIRAQYTLGYLSTNDRTDGAWRKVDIRVKGAGGRCDCRVRARKGYFGPAGPPKQP